MVRASISRGYAATDLGLAAMAFVIESGEVRTPEVRAISARSGELCNCEYGESRFGLALRTRCAQTLLRDRCDSVGDLRAMSGMASRTRADAITQARAGVGDD